MRAAREARLFFHSRPIKLLIMALSLPFPSLMLRLPASYLAGYVECCSSVRVFCSYQPKWFIIRQFFFLSLFTTDTNAGQSHRLTNRIQNLRRYNLKSLTFNKALSTFHTHLQKHYSSFKTNRSQMLYLILKFIPSRPKYSC